MTAGFSKGAAPQPTRLQREAQARDRAARAHLAKTCGRGYFNTIERIEAEIARLGIQKPTALDLFNRRREQLDELREVMSS